MITWSESDLQPRFGLNVLQKRVHFLISTIRTFDMNDVFSNDKQKKREERWKKAHIACKMNWRRRWTTTILLVVWRSLHKSSRKSNLNAFGAIDFIPNIGKSIYYSITTSIWVSMSGSVRVCALKIDKCTTWYRIYVPQCAWPKYVDVLVKRCKIFSVFILCRFILIGRRPKGKKMAREQKKY